MTRSPIELFWTAKNEISYRCQHVFYISCPQHNWQKLPKRLLGSFAIRLCQACLGIKGQSGFCDDEDLESGVVGVVGEAGGVRLAAHHEEAGRA